MKNNFQTVLIGIFLAFFAFAVLIFSGILPIGQKKTEVTSIVGSVVVWGVFDDLLLIDLFESIGTDNKDSRIDYVQKNEATYQNDLLEAFAKGDGPDIFIISNNTLLKNKSFIYQIPYTSYSKRLFQDNFIDGADIYLDKDGVDALPLVVDPLMLYYNKALLSNAGISTPPVYWDELFALNDKLTKKRADGIITQSMIALGAYNNITNAKDILSMLFIQNDNSIVNRKNGEIFIDFNKENRISNEANNELVEFFTEFSNPLGKAYSWNKGLISSKNLFTGNNLAVNPNLSFDVAPMLQIRNDDTNRTVGDIYAVAINKNSKNMSGAFGVAYSLSSSKYVDLFSKSLSLPPALKTSLLINPTDPYLYSFYKTAISLRTWLDPDSKATDDVFSRFVENVISGKASISDSMNRLQSELDLLIKQ